MKIYAILFAILSIFSVAFISACGSSGPRVTPKSVQSMSTDKLQRLDRKFTGQLMEDLSKLKADPGNANRDQITQDKNNIETVENELSKRGFNVD